MLHSEKIHVEETVDAIGETALLCPVELRALDSASDALVPANLSQAVCFYCESASSQLAYPRVVEEAQLRP